MPTKLLKSCPVQGGRLIPGASGEQSSGGEEAVAQAHPNSQSRAAAELLWEAQEDRGSWDSAEVLSCKGWSEHPALQGFFHCGACPVSHDESP